MHTGICIVYVTGGLGGCCCWGFEGGGGGSEGIMQTPTSCCTPVKFASLHSSFEYFGIIN